ncbi:hypothetical protein [Mycobacterium intermedium]|uniref:hypothetical protein n=1 Tax=Mycobacterium intermedium TaxID=28445 RepID=UPI0039E99FC2
MPVTLLITSAACLTVAAASILAGVEEPPFAPLSEEQPLNASAVARTAVAAATPARHQSFINISFVRARLFSLCNGYVVAGQTDLSAAAQPGIIVSRAVSAGTGFEWIYLVPAATAFGGESSKEMS